MYTNLAFSSPSLSFKQIWKMNLNWENCFKRQKSAPMQHRRGLQVLLLTSCSSNWKGRNSLSLTAFSYSAIPEILHQGWPSYILVQRKSIISILKNLTPPSRKKKNERKKKAMLQSFSVPLLQNGVNCKCWSDWKWKPSAYANLQEVSIHDSTSWINIEPFWLEKTHKITYNERR